MSEPQIDDGGHDAILPERVGPFLSRFGGQHDESVHLQELHEGSPHRHVVFHDEHERTYGHKAPDEPVEIVNLRSAARGKTDLTRPERPATGGAASSGQSRDAYFGPDHGRMQTQVLSRPDLNTLPRHGPIIIDEYDATVVVPPDCAASLDQWNNIIIDVGQK